MLGGVGGWGGWGGEGGVVVVVGGGGGGVCGGVVVVVVGGVVCVCVGGGGGGGGAGGGGRRPGLQVKGRGAALAGPPVPTPRLLALRAHPVTCTHVTVQVRVPLAELPALVRRLTDMELSWDEVAAKYPAQAPASDE